MTRFQLLAAACAVVYMTPLAALAEENMVMAATTAEFPTVMPFCEIQEHRDQRLCGSVTYIEPTPLDESVLVYADDVGNSLLYQGLDADRYADTEFVIGEVIFRMFDPAAFAATANGAT